MRGSVPEGWSIARLGDICRVIPGFAFKSKDWRKEGIAVVRIKNIKSDRTIDCVDIAYVPEGIYTDRLSKFKLRDGDILIAMTGATAGKVGKLRTKELMLLNQRVAKIEPIRANRDFVWAVVSSDEYERRFYQLADGAAQPNMSGSQIEGIGLLLPPPAIQEKIASILSAYDDLIENNLRRIKILEEMAQALYREWFVKFRFPGHESVRMIDSELGMIPEGWTAKLLGEICSRITDGSHSSPKSVEQGLPMASVKDLTPFNVNLESCRRISSDDFSGLVRQGCQPEAGDILIAKDGASALDTVCLLHQTLEVVLLSSVAILRADSREVVPSFLHRYMDDDNTRSYMKNAFITGAAIPRVVLKDFARVVVLVPPMSLQKRFDDFSRPSAEEIQVLIKKNLLLRRSRDLLLPKLISGKLDVSELAFDVEDSSDD